MYSGMCFYQCGVKHLVIWPVAIPHCRNHFVPLCFTLLPISFFLFRSLFPSLDPCLPLFLSLFSSSSSIVLLCLLEAVSTSQLFDELYISGHATRNVTMSSVCLLLLLL